MTFNNDEKAVRALPALHSFATEATQLAEELLVSEIRFDVDNDHFGFMAMCFLGEQVSYLEAITKLVEQGLGKPSGLVARSMLEGMALLRWARADPSRSMRWRSYAWVTDHRAMARVMKSGNSIDLQQKTHIEEALKIQGDQFFSPKAKKKKAAGQQIPNDPYVRSWYAPNSLASICAQDQSAKLLYENIYRDESERTHWSVASLGRSVHRNEGGFVYTHNAHPCDDATFLAVGFQSLLEVLLDAEEHLGLGRNSDICDLRNRYISELAGTQIS